VVELGDGESDAEGRLLVVGIVDADFGGEEGLAGGGIVMAFMRAS
jgi:hypothetical protein